MSKGSSAPPPPDPEILAKAQGAENRKTFNYQLDASRANSRNPFGSHEWTKTPSFDQAGFDAAMAAYKPSAWVGGSPGILSGGGGSGGAEGNGPNDGGMSGGTPGYMQPETGTMPNRDDFTKNTWSDEYKLNEGSQKIFDTSTDKLQEALGGLSTNPDQYNQSVADAIFSRMRRFQDPADAQARSGLQANLADRGFQVGNEGYNADMTRMDNNQGMMRADAADRSVISGMEQGREQQSAQQRLAAFLQNMRQGQSSGVAQLPGQMPTPGMSPVPVAQMAMDQWGQQVDQANAENASGDALMGSLLSLGGMAMGSPWLGAAMGAGAGALGGGGGRSSGKGMRAPSTGFWSQ